jgi:hypothetical protein
MGRTIVVGDVHGCSWELGALLDRVGFTSGDRLVFVGDLVARGPDSLGVLDIARSTGATIVRGNHEQKLLDWRDHDARLGRLHEDLAQSLRDVDWTLLETSPLWCDFPEHGLRVVHAGVLPGIPIEKQSHQVLMTLRTIGRRGEPAGRSGTLWGKRYQGSPHLVFGHNAAPGLQLHACATGLDTACVYGGRLSAMVLQEGEKVVRSKEGRLAQIVFQPAQRVWFEAKNRAA